MKNNIINIQHDTKRRVVGIFATGNKKVSDDLIFKESVKIQGHYFIEIPSELTGNFILFVFDRTGSSNKMFYSESYSIDKGELLNGFSAEDRSILKEINLRKIENPDNKNILNILEKISLLHDFLIKNDSSTRDKIFDEKINSILLLLKNNIEKTDLLKNDFKNILSSSQKDIYENILYDINNVIKEVKSLNNFLNSIKEDLNKKEIKYNYCAINIGQNTLPVNIKYDSKIKSGFIYSSSGNNTPVQIKKFNEEISFVSFDFTEESDYVFYIPGLYYLFIKCCKDSEVLTKENKIQIEEIAKKLMIL